MASKVFVITGPSGVGKGTLIRELLEAVPDLELSVSATTRAPREGEVDGRDYHFLTPEQFEQRIDEDDFLEFATYSGNRYGTLRSEVERRLEAGHSVVLEIEVQGAQQVRAAIPTRSRSSSPRPTPRSCASASPAAAPIRRRRSTAGSRSPSRSWRRRATSTTASSTTSSAAPPTSWWRSSAPSSASPAGRSSRLPGR